MPRAKPTTAHEFGRHQTALAAVVADTGAHRDDHTTPEELEILLKVGTQQT
jgi:hypothetical protein